MDVNAVAFLLLVLMMQALHLALHVEPKFFLEIVADHFSKGVYLFYLRRYGRSVHVCSGTVGGR